MKHNILTLNKEFVYALVIVMLLVFGLFFLNQYFDISASAFIVKEHENSVGERSFSDELGERFEGLDGSETFKNSISP